MFLVRKWLAVAKNQLSAVLSVAPNIHLRLMHRIGNVRIDFNEQIRNDSEVSDTEIRILSIQTQTIETRNGLNPHSVGLLRSTGVPFARIGF